LPGFQVSGWNAIVAPRGAPAAVVKRINSEINAGFAEPDVMDRLRRQSIEPFTGTPGQLSAHIRSERIRFGKLVQSAGLKVE
jgi:tripartite-type tricarboxylate transporter receptor subunit TctC